MQKKFYAEYKPITRDRRYERAVFGHSREIAVFDTEQERDSWVNFQDPFSRLDPEFKEYGAPRRTLSTAYAVRIIKQTLHKVLVNDIANPNQKWYLLGGAI